MVLGVFFFCLSVCFFLWFLVILGGYWQFLVVLGGFVGYWWFFGFLGGS